MELTTDEIRAVVVIPARDEEATIEACLDALARQTIGTGAFEVVLVADACSDQTAERAAAAAARSGLRLQVVEGPGTGSGGSRRTGLDVAAERLLALGLEHGLIASTDADSVPAPDWLARQLDHLERGARVVAGLVELDAEDAATLPPGVVRRRELDAARRLARVTELDPAAAHHHFAGASLGLTAETYRAVGGIEASSALEDDAFARRLRRHGIPIVRAADVRVRTSARAHGRVQRGLSVDLAVALWLENRRYRAVDFPPERLRELKGATTISVVIPTKECAATIDGVLRETVEPLRRARVVDEVLVVDSGSADGTARLASGAGARVVQQDDVLSEYGPAIGKGDAMWRGAWVSEGDLVCFLDGDTSDPHVHHLQGLLGPLLTEPAVAFVKGAFDRPLRRGDEVLPHEGGRVTELMARPLLNLHEPRLAGLTQPLAGEFAVRRSLLEHLPFPVGYGVEIGLLIDALRACGLDAIAECHLGTRQNRHQPLRALGEMAFAVLATVERRLDGARSATSGQFLRPWEDGLAVTVPLDERPPLASIVSQAA